MNKVIIAFCFLLSAFTSNSQQIKRYNPDTIRTIVIDSVINIRSHRLNTQDFIDAVLADTGFYQAFQNMKKYAFIAENRIYTYDKHNRVDGKIYRKIKHSNTNGKHVMTYLAKRDSGQVYKSNGKFELYTVEMFDYIFMNPSNSDFVKGPGFAGGTDESYKDKLKTLVFSPGHRVKGIPFVSGKTEIFSKDLKDYYYYQYARGKYLDSIPVYRFRVLQKPSTNTNDVIIKEMTTIFDMRNLQVLGRYIDLKYSNFLGSFDVQMNIEMANFNEELLPTKITYQGNWDVPFHKTERASFLIVHKGYTP